MASEEHAWVTMYLEMEPGWEDGGTWIPTQVTISENPPFIPDSMRYSNVRVPLTRHPTPEEE